MMNFKKIIFTTLKAISILLIALLIVFKCTLMHVENKIINNYSTELNTLKDTVIIHFIHGSIPMKNCIYPRERLGGLLGGHVEIEINKQVYGFRLNKLPVHIFVDKDNFNSRFEINTHDAWIKRTEHEKMTSIYLPINSEQNDRLQSILDVYLAKSPYDYAFFGTRCASSTADILSKSGIILPLSNFENMVAFLSPHPLRSTLLHLAEKNNFLITNKKGVDCRYWE